MNTTVSSTAHIKIPSLNPESTPAAPKPQAMDPFDEAHAAFIADVRDMLDACCAANRNERLVNVITACIEGGYDTMGQIIGVAKAFGFKREHVGATVTSSSRGKSMNPLWHCDDEGRYRLVG